MYAKDVFALSLDRCLQSERFVRAFYQRLLASSDEIAAKFRFTDMDRQRGMLESSLKLCGDAVAGTPEGLAQLTETGRSHDRFHRDVKPEWYPLWLDAIVATAADFDPKWSPEVEQAWRTVLGFVTARIASFYDA
ncbi:hypothetical protein Pla175_29670 [Pirellulimonas nuda]|uniref:Globin domain-containing protein n=1 Tax=Pirellulimonas nuda TaxID=2528009 RepID=A0A518DDL6_9BACT|nr:globin domain-containing protein [Pirellulimonas nuda]QDU89575.1 hypothetical protein Pla175_29670 [Pirellulimonas nuda]